MRDHTLPRPETNDKVLKELARIFSAMVNDHGVEVALGALDDKAYYALYMYFLGVQRREPDPYV